MQQHYSLSDSEFVSQFEGCTLDPNLFSHEAHLRLGWILISQYGLEKAELKVHVLLKNFVAHVGAEDKYHKTLTLASMKIIHHFKRKAKSDNFKDFILEFPQLETNFKGLISTHYSFDIFDSLLAKIRYLKPDLIPFD